MGQPAPKSEPFVDPEALAAAMRREVQRVIWEHKQLGYPIVVWRDGKVVWLQPHEIEVEKPDDEPTSPESKQTA
jgi:hypothetical protein